MVDVDYKKISSKWQKKWADASIFKVYENSKKKKFYCLEMYPYPSASGLHMGHALNYTIGDIFARFKRMQGFNVLYSMGFDSFGLPAENAAVKAKSHPKKFTEEAIANYIKQMKSLGLSYDWDRMVETHKPNYYKWDQWIFLKMYKQGLAYKRMSAVNWCPKCQTVLANEQVHNGKCWRHEDTNVRLKELNQWFFKTTNYAEELLKELDGLDWNDDIKTMQRNWIGKSKGTLMHFDIEGSDKKLTVFTTRPDTFFGITYLVCAPEHPDVMELVKGTDKEKEVQKFIRKVVLEDKFTRTAENKEKEGMFIGRYAINPITKEKIPIYIANFVLFEYGTGAIIAVPAHDQRDFEFAKKYNIPIKVVINPPQYDLNAQKMSRAYMGDGNMVNSQEFNGINNREAIEEITKLLDKKKCGGFTTQYKLRDWLISRQRFWGTPIPIIYCDKCGTVPVPEKDLPVKLPEKIKFSSAENPLLSYKPFTECKCPKCGGKAQRETDTMDTFVNSSWYFLRYCDPKNEKEIFSPNKVKYWMPVDLYIGGREHACMHLIYFRFYTKFLRDLGLLKFDEPAGRLFNQGMLHGQDGVVMSKSRGNVVLPEEVSKKYGIDTARLFLVSVASQDKDLMWSDTGVEGSLKFLNKFYKYVHDVKIGKTSKRLESKIHGTIKDVTHNIETMRYNYAVIKIRTLFESLEHEIAKKDLESCIKILAPLCPHLAEELWEKIGNKRFISLEKWPSFDKKKIDEKLDYLDEVIDNLRKDVHDVLNLLKIKKPTKLKFIVANAWKYKFVKTFRQINSRNMSEIMAKLPFDLKKYGQEISKIVPGLLKDASKMPKLDITMKDEFETLIQNKELLGKEFGCSVTIEEADKSKEQKAKIAMPGKPAIVVN